MKTRIRFRTENDNSTRYTRRGRIALGWLGELCLLASIASAAIGTLYFLQQDMALPSAAASRSDESSDWIEHSPIYGMSISADHNQIMIVRSGRFAQSANVGTDEIEVNATSEQGVSCVEFSSNGKQLALGHTDGSVWIRDRQQTTDVRLDLPAHDAIMQLAFSRDGERLVIGNEFGRVMIWNFKTQRCERQFRAGARRIDALAVSPDSRSFIATTNNSNIMVRDIETGAERFSLGCPNLDTCSACVFTEDSRQLICGFVGGGLKAFDLQSRELLWETECHSRHSVLDLAISPDGRTFACGALSPYLEIHDVATGEVVNTFPAHRIGVRCIRFLPGSDFLVSAGYDGEVRVWCEDDWCPLYSL